MLVSFAGARARRDNGRLQALQAEFARLGFALDPLTQDTLILQRWGMRRVLRSLDETERLLEQIRSVPS